MDLQTTLKLLDAGYTKEEIKQMIPSSSSSPEPAAAPEPEKKQEPEQKPETNQERKPEQKPEQLGDTNKIIADLTKQVSDLAGVVKQMQETNVKNAQQQAPAKETAQTVLESFFGKPN